MVSNAAELIKLIARRDEISENEAEIAVAECVEMMKDALERGDFVGVEDVLRTELGLEPDYLDFLLDSLLF